MNIKRNELKVNAYYIFVFNILKSFARIRRIFYMCGDQIHPAPSFIGGHGSVCLNPDLAEVPLSI